MDSVEIRTFWGKSLRDVHHLSPPAVLPQLTGLCFEDGGYVVRHNNREYPLRPGAVAIVRQEELTFALRLVKPMQLPRASRPIDYAFVHVIVVVSFLMAAWVTAMLLYPDEVQALDELALLQRADFVHAVLQTPTKPEPILQALSSTPATPSATGAGRKKAAPKPGTTGVLAALKSGAMSELLSDHTGDVQAALNDVHAPAQTAALGGLDSRTSGFDPAGDTQSTGIGPPRTRGRLPGDARYGEDKTTLGRRQERDVVIEDAPAKTSGSLPPELIQQVMRENRNAFRYCYERALQAQHDLSGLVKLQFIIGSEGGVTSAQVKESTFGDDAVPGCLLGKVRALAFPKPRGGGIVVVTYPFVFKAR